MKRNQNPSKTIRARLAAGALALTVVAACSSSGSSCAGCNTQTIPGGFPGAKTFENAMMAQVSDDGLTFLEQNIGSLVAGFMPSGLSFAIPATGCKDPKATLKMCCSTSVNCQATAEITGAKLTPKAPNKLAAEISAVAWSGTGTAANKKLVKMPVTVIFLGVTVNCDMALNAANGAKKALAITTTVAFNTAKTAPKELSLAVSGTDFKDLEGKDITISGSNAICGAFNAFLQTPGMFAQFLPLIKSSLITPIEAELKKQIAAQLFGQEGRIDLGAAMSAFSPATTGVLDYYVWAGGYAEATEAPKTEGLSLGVLGGFAEYGTSTCVPDCEAAGASCSPPAKETIARSTALESGKDAAGKAFHLGVGVHRYTLAKAGYAAYRSGALCLDVGTATSSMITSSIFEIFLPSMKTLTNGQNSPVSLALRPQKPPTFTLGLGTYTTDSKGTPTIKEPLLTVTLPDLAIDFFVMVDERYIRVFRVTGDLAIPILLFPDGKGNLTPVIGDLSNAMSNIKSTENDLVAADAAKIATIIPTLIGLATSFMGDALKPIAIPAIQGLDLQLGPGSITSIDKDSAGKYTLLAIFAKLAKAKTTSLPLPAYPEPGAEAPQVQTRAELIRVVPADLSQGVRLGHGPVAEISLAAVLPAALAGREVEYTWRLDGGFYHPWTSGPTLKLRDPLLWLEGVHRLEVFARVKGEIGSFDSTPAEVLFHVQHQRGPEAVEGEMAGGCALTGVGQSNSVTLLPLALLLLVILAVRRQRGSKNGC